MGWASGSDLMDRVIYAASAVPKTRRQEFYRLVIKAFEHHDCDTLDECLGQDGDFDVAFMAMHPQEEDYDVEL